MGFWFLGSAPIILCTIKLWNQGIRLLDILWKHIAPGHLICLYIQLGLQGETKVYDEGDKGRTEMLGQIVTILPVVALTVLCLCPLLVSCPLILGHCRGSSVLWETEKKGLLHFDIGYANNSSSFCKIYVIFNQVRSVMKMKWQLISDGA